MRTTSYQSREAARIGTDRTLHIHDCRTNNASWAETMRKCREVRAENMRRTAAAS